MARSGYYEDELLERCRPKMIDNLIGHKAREKAWQIVEWIKTINGNSLVLSGCNGVGRHTLVEVSCKEIGCTYKNIRISTNDDSASVANRILQLRNAFGLPNSARLVIVVDKLEDFQGLQLLQGELACQEIPKLIFIVDDKHVDDVIHALPLAQHMPVFYPSHFSIKSYLKAIAFMEGLSPITRLNRNFMKRYNRDIGRMIKHICHWTKECPAKLNVCCTGSSQDIWNAMKALHEIGGRSQEQVNDNVTMLVTQDKSDMTKRIREAHSKGIPVVTTKQLIKYVSIIKKILHQQTLFVKEWEKALNQILERQHLIDEHRGNWYESDRLSGSRKYRPDDRCMMLVISDYFLDPYHIHYSRLVCHFSSLKKALDNHQINQQNITYLRTPDVEIYNCCTSKLSLIGLHRPTKEVLISSLRKFFQAKCQHKYLVFLGDLTNGGWMLSRGQPQFVSYTEVAHLLRRTTVPILGGKSRLFIFPGLYLSDLDKMRFENESINEILVPNLIHDLEKLKWEWHNIHLSDSLIAHFVGIVIKSSHLKQLPPIGTLEWNFIF